MHHKSDHDGNQTILNYRQPQVSTTGFPAARPWEKLSNRRLGTEVNNGEKPGFLRLRLPTASQMRRNIAFSVGNTPKADQLTL